MAEAKRDSKQAVVPGTFLTTEEEYTPGRNTSEDSSGNVYSCCVGEAEFDGQSREVRVRSPKPLERLEAGSIVTAVVTDVRDSMVLVEIISAEKNGEKRVFAMSHASVPVRDIDTKYVERTRDMFKIGDIIKARVEQALPYGIDLSTKDPNLGVIKAFCTRCRSPLKGFGTDLKCLKCGSTESRKTSKEYVSD